jgi:hypothetical protein
MHVHNDRIMTAKQKRLEAQGFIGARVTGLHFNFKLLPILGRTGGSDACGLRRHHAEGLDSRKIRCSPRLESERHSTGRQQ